MDEMAPNCTAQFYIQLVYKPHFGTFFLFKFNTFLKVGVMFCKCSTFRTFLNAAIEFYFSIWQFSFCSFQISLKPILQTVRPSFIYSLSISHILEHFFLFDFNTFLKVCVMFYKCSTFRPFYFSMGQFRQLSNLFETHPWYQCELCSSLLVNHSIAVSILSIVCSK